jgi:hypothetical protein
MGEVFLALIELISALLSVAARWPKTSAALLALIVVWLRWSR